MRARLTAHNGKQSLRESVVNDHNLKVLRTLGAPGIPFPARAGAVHA